MLAIDGATACNFLSLVWYWPCRRLNWVFVFWMKLLNDTWAGKPQWPLTRDFDPIHWGQHDTSGHQAASMLSAILRQLTQEPTCMSSALLKFKYPACHSLQQIMRLSSPIGSVTVESEGALGGQSSGYACCSGSSQVWQDGPLSNKLNSSAFHNGMKWANIKKKHKKFIIECVNCLFIIQCKNQKQKTQSFLLQVSQCLGSIKNHEISKRCMFSIREHYGVALEI